MPSADGSIADGLERGLAGGAHGHQVGGGSAAAEDPGVGRRHAAQVGQPVQGQLLDVVERGQEVADVTGDLRRHAGRQRPRSWPDR